MKAGLLYPSSPPPTTPHPEAVRIPREVGSEAGILPVTAL